MLKPSYVNFLAQNPYCDSEPHDAIRLIYSISECPNALDFGQERTDMRIADSRLSAPTKDGAIFAGLGRSQ